MKPSYLLIVNPRSANRSTGRLWPKIEERLRSLIPQFDFALTKGPGDATRLAREAVGRYKVVVAVGGDGTVGEVVNGLVREDGSVASGVALGVIPRGTGSDFARSLGVPRSLREAATALSRGRSRAIDVGRARFLAPDGSAAGRYFINAAEVGLGAVVTEAVGRASKWMGGGSAAYWWAILLGVLRYRDQPVSISVDGSPEERVVLSNAWIANGRYSGAGLRSAPRARLDDGLLDLVRVDHVGPLRRFAGLFKLRSGAFVELPQVDYRKVRCVEVRAETPVPVETDGDPVGTVPATFDVLPGCLTVIS